jgi:hypothetical protein
MAEFTLTSLSTYTSQISEFFTPVVIPATLSKGGIEIMDNVKYKTALNKLYSEIYLQNTTCGISPSGYTLPSQITLEVCQLSYFDKYCFVGSTNQYWFNELMRPGSDIANNEWFNRTFLPYLGELLTEQVERIFWQGDTTFGTGNLALCDGILSRLSGDTAHLVTGTTTNTSSNVIDNIIAWYTKLPAKVQFKPLTLNLDPAIAALLPAAYAAKNWYNYGAVTNETATFPLYPNMKIVPQSGMLNSGKIVLTVDNNLVYGTDVLGEELNFQWQPNPFDKYVYYGVDWKQGAAIKEPGLIVTNFA